MKVQVTINNVKIIKETGLNENEYNIHEFEFDFVEEYEGLTKKAVFTDANEQSYIETIVNNKCSVPTEVLHKNEYVTIGVYAYAVEDEELKLRYSPQPTHFFVNEGSYKSVNNSTPPTPSEIEQLQAQITHNRNDIDELQQTTEQHGETIQTINENITIINEAIGTINENIGDLQEQQIEQNRNIQANADDIIEINQDINEIDSSINTINQNIDNLEQDLTNYSLITETGSQINLNVNNTNYQITAILKDKNGNVIYTSNAIDLPIESMIVNASYDNTTKEIVLTLQNGNTLRISVADLVSGLVSETQLQTILANYYNKTEVDNLLSNLAERVSTNEEDIADIKEEQTTQNTNIEELQNQVETLQEDLESANSEIEELNTDITNMRKAMLQVEGQGTDITLENTSENKFVEFGLEGRTEQEQLEGKNLFDANAIGNSNITIENDGAKITLPISSAGGGAVSTFKKLSELAPQLEVGQTYKLLIDSVIDYIYIGTMWSNSRVLTITQEMLDSIMYLYSKNDSSVTIKNMMIIKSTETNTDFEKFCGGIPAPNPIYKIPIKNVTGNANVKIQNRNLFDGKLELGIYSGSTGAKSPSDRHIRSVNYIEVDELSDYKFSLSNGNGISLYIYEYKKDFSYNQSASKLVNSSSHLVTNKDTKYITFRTYNENTDVNTKIQLEKGKSITSYVEHQEQNYPFTFAEGQRGMEGTQLLDDGINNKHKQRVFDGTENFSINSNYTTENILCVQITINDVKPATNQCLCSHFKYYSTSNIKNVFRFAGKFLLFTVDRNEYATLEDFKTKFANEYANGTPVIVEYELAESELENNIIPYNATQQAQYNAIKEASSYDDITYISSESDELGFNMNVVAVADANKAIDKELQEIKSAVIALGGDINV